MEHFYEDGFEKYLKEQADQFKIEPSKKAWHGIYNNFHPGRRWPSAATGLMIILLLTLTNNLNTRQQRELLEKYSVSANADKKTLKTHTHSTGKETDDEVDFSTIRDMIASLSPQESIIPAETSISTVQNEDLIAGNQQPQTVQPSVAVTPTKAPAPLQVNNTGQSPVQKEMKKPLTEESGATNIPEENSDNSGSFILGSPVESLQRPLANILSQKDYMDGIDYLKARFKKVRKNPVHLTYYVSPTINYRTSTKVEALIPPDPGSNTQYVTIGNKSGIQHIAPGLEVGTALSFRLAKHLEFSGGFQMNYSGYNITASYIHPIVSSLLLINNGTAQAVPAISYYSNDNTQYRVTLHSYNIEASLPVGLKYEFFRNDNLTLKVVSNLAPTLLLFQRSYLLSADTRNYVSDPDLTRNINLNAGLGVYMGFNINKTKYQIGPQFRSQVLSNFKNNSPYSEHLFNYGIRLAVGR